MLVTHGSKNSLFFVFDSLSNWDCGQWYKFGIYQRHPMSAPATQSVDSRARASFSQGHFCVHSFFFSMVGHFLLRIATRRRDSQGSKPHYVFFNWHCKRSYTPFLSSMEHLCVLQLETALETLVTTWFTLADCRWKSRYRSSDKCILKAFRSPEHCKFYRWMDTVGMFQKFNKLFIAMYTLHVNVIYKPEPWKRFF